MLGNCVKTDKTQNLTNCNKFFISLHFFTALALASFECEAPEKSYEKEKHKQLK